MVLHSQRSFGGDLREVQASSALLGLVLLRRLLALAVVEGSLGEEVVLLPAPT